jgi:hypothetical protein
MYFAVMRAEPIYDLGVMDERTAKALRAVFDAGRESMAPRITREDVDRIVRETIAIVSGWPGHGGRFMTPDLTDAVLSALGMTEGTDQ